MFVGIKVCVFEIKLSSPALIFVVSSSTVNFWKYLCYVCWYLCFCDFKDGREICQINPSQTLMNLQYMTALLLFEQYGRKKTNADCAHARLTQWYITFKTIRELRPPQD